ncbi:MAG TPA: hypothetical protein VIT20_06840 [Propionibacteriaceae bacterium]
MTERRWPWWAASITVLAAAAATGWATYLHWLPCRGTMLSASILRGYAYGPDFSDACLRRMDGGLPFPFPSEPAEMTPGAAELGVIAVALAALAWLVLVLGLRWSIADKAIAALPGLATMMVALAAAQLAGDAGRGPDESGPGWLWWLPDLMVVGAFIALALRRPALTRRTELRLVVMLWGTSAFGFVHQFAAYLTAASLSDANWDNPPGTGYGTALVLVFSAVATIVLGLRNPRFGGSVPDDPHRAGVDTDRDLRLAADR